MGNAKEEYFFLTDRLDRVEWAIRGECDDVDCNKYLFKYLFKRKYKPTLEHDFSCVKKLRLEKEALLRVLSQKKYKGYRHTRCKVCKKMLDKLSNKSTLVSFTKPSEYKGKKCSEMKVERVHKKCEKRFVVPKGWNKF